MSAAEVQDYSLHFVGGAHDPTSILHPALAPDPARASERARREARPAWWLGRREAALRGTPGGAVLSRSEVGQRRRVFLSAEAQRRLESEYGQERVRRVCGRRRGWED